MATPSPAPSHTWNFFRAGGFDQVQIDTGADLLALKELDQKLWVALSCPTRGIEFDTKTLDLIDSDDGCATCMQMKCWAQSPGRAVAEKSRSAGQGGRTAWRWLI